MIVITGATGALNGATADHLLDVLPAQELAVVARDPEAARRFADRGVEVRRGDYADAVSLPAAFAGADQLLLVSSSDPTADAVALHRAAIDAAVEVGVGRILYTSHQGASPDTPFGPGRDHAATEALLAASGLPWTSLRNGFYAHSLEWLAGPWRESGEIVVPVDGPVSWTAREDAAAAAAAIILALRVGSTAFDGPVTLTAPAAPTFVGVAEIASEVVGAPIGVRILGEDAWLDAQREAGHPEGRSRFTLGMYRAAAEGCFAGTAPTLGKLLGEGPIGSPGRKPRSVRDEIVREVGE